jgi:hypothetical protein
MRFMIRFLAGKLDKNHPISMYVNGYKEDIWDEEILKKDYLFENLDRHFL